MRRLRAVRPLHAAALAGLLGAGLAAWAWVGGAHAEAPPCAAPTRTVRYPQVEPIFARHCAGCHDARKGSNRAAQRVFEMSSYPFSTARPDTLLADLRGMFASRGNLSQAEKCTGIAWVDGGGRDARGQPPRWRAP